MLSANEREAFRHCEAYVKDWAPSYMHHTQLLGESVGIFSFRTIWSKPTQEKPISEFCAVATVTVDMTGDTPEVKHTLDAGHVAFTGPLRRQEQQLDRHIADKAAVRATLAKLDNADRLPKPQPYSPGAVDAPASPGAVAPDKVIGETDEELETMLITLFRDADADGNGVLDVEEFFSLFQTADLGLSQREVEFLLSEADVSGDGVVQYNEFVPIAVDVIQSLRLREQTAEALAEQEEAATDEAVTTLYGLERDELEAMMQDAFTTADVNGDGMLSRAEFSACLENVRLGPTRLSKREIRYFQAVVELDESGRISYEAFVPVMWDLLVETLKSNYLASSQGELYEYLRDLCVAADTGARAPTDTVDGGGADGDDAGAEAAAADATADGGGESAPPAVTVEAKLGRLSRDALKAVMLETDRIRLTPVQVYAVLAEAEEDEDGMVEYGAFLLRAVPLISTMIAPVLNSQRQQAAKRALLTPVAVLGGVEKEELETKLRAVFDEYDSGGAGKLSKADFAKCLRNADLGLTNPQVNALFSAADSDQDGNVSIDEFMAIAYDVLLTLGREKALQDAMGKAGSADELVASIGGAAQLLAALPQSKKQ